MRLVPLELESMLREKGLWPESRTARAGVYVLALDVLYFVVQMLTSRVAPSVASSLGGWVSFLSGLAIVLFGIVGFRWARTQLLWRLRNRLIVTYVFIGVIPVILLALISFITLYLLAGQFANFVATSEITNHLRGMSVANRAIANELATQIDKGQRPTTDTLAVMRSHDADFGRRQVCAWTGRDASPSCSGPAGTETLALATFFTVWFRGIGPAPGEILFGSANGKKSRFEQGFLLSGGAGGTPTVYW